MSDQTPAPGTSEGQAANADTGADGANTADSNADGSNEGSTEDAFEAAVASLEAEESGADGQNEAEAGDTDQSNEGESDVDAKADTEEDATAPKGPEKKPATDEAKRLRKLGTTLATRDANLQKREIAVKAIENKAAFVDKIVDLSRRDKIAAIREIGISEDEIVELVMKRAEAANAGPETAEDRIARLEKQIADDRAAQTQAGKQAQENQFRAEVAAAIKADDSLDLIKTEPDGTEMVITAMAAYLQKHKVVPNPIHIARQLETALEKRERERFGKSKKFLLSDRRTANNNAATTRKENSPPAKKGPSVTLTDHMADSVSLGDDGLPDDPTDRFNALVAQMNA